MVQFQKDAVLDRLEEYVRVLAPEAETARQLL